MNWIELNLAIAFVAYTSHQCACLVWHAYRETEWEWEWEWEWECGEGGCFFHWFCFHLYPCLPLLFFLWSCLSTPFRNFYHHFLVPFSEFSLHYISSILYYFVICDTISDRTDPLRCTKISWFELQDQRFISHDLVLL